MKKTLLAITVSVAAALAYAADFNAPTAPALDDREREALRKINKILFDSTAASQSSDTMLKIATAGAPNHAAGQVSVSTASAQALALRSNRRGVTVKNMGTNPIFIGAAGVTASTGYQLTGGESISIDSRAAIFAIATGGASTLCYIESYDGN